MILSYKYHNLAQKVLILTVFILVLEVCFPHQLKAGEIGSFYNGPILVQISSDGKNDAGNLAASFEGRKPKMVRYVTVTAYSSTVDQCDDTPFITANGKWVYDGLVAANFLKFGTEIKIPEYFGDKVFTVNDRMNPKYNSRVDVWMPTREAAVQFGARYLKIEIY
jgi:3D (Asp-Asp-Asp) domain-containing protein